MLTRGIRWICTIKIYYYITEKSINKAMLRVLHLFLMLCYTVGVDCNKHSIRRRRLWQTVY